MLTSTGRATQKDLRKEADVEREFLKLMEEINEFHLLTASAIEFLPKDLSIRTKKELVKRGAEEAAEFLLDVIGEIQSGTTVETVDELMWKRIFPGK